MTPLAARIALLTAASAGLLAGTAGGASAAATSGDAQVTSQPQDLGGMLGGTLKGVGALPLSTDPVRTLTGGAIDPASDNIDTVGNLPLGTSPINGVLENNGNLSSLGTIPVVGPITRELTGQ
jgi:hypothetical protein